jgi:hypothetical protein
VLVYVPPTITYFYGFNRTLIRDDIIDNHHFSKCGKSGKSGTVKYLALCQILTPLIESSPKSANFWLGVRDLRRVYQKVPKEEEKEDYNRQRQH